MIKITKDVSAIRATDDIDLFEGQYAVKGMTYNSYVIGGKVVLDTVDTRKVDEWKTEIETLAPNPEYLIVSHVEPDHSSGVSFFLNKHKNVTVVASAAAFGFIKNFYGIDPEKKLIVKDGDTLEVAGHTLIFVAAPFVHWPEVMMTYDATDGILFSADGFGRFGADLTTDWTDEARRYYINIVGKYGAQVQAVLKKASALKINAICPLHGETLTGDLSKYIDLYDKWSSYTPETNGTLIACASIYGNTKNVAEAVKTELESRGETAEFIDLTRIDLAQAVALAFKYDKLVLAAPSYDGGLFPCAEFFLMRLKSKNYQNRRVALIENGTWAPSSARVMQSYLNDMKNINVCHTLTIKSANNASPTSALVDSLLS